MNIPLSIKSRDKTETKEYMLDLSAQYHVFSKQNVVTRVVPVINTPQYLIPTISLLCSHLGTRIFNSCRGALGIRDSVMTIDKTDPVVLQ